MRRVSRRRLLLLVVAAVVLGACGDSKDASDASESKLPTRTIEAGEVTVTIEPTSITSSAAAFEVVFDTHAVDLDLDVAEASHLIVDGTEWTVASWDGAGPGGHHREGSLTFEAAGKPTGTAELTIDGLDEPVRATWNLAAL